MTGRHLAWQAAAFVAAGVLGVGYLQLVQAGLDVFWTTVPDALGHEALISAYVVAMLVVGAAAVAFLRARTGVFGHSPLDGLAVSAEPVRASLLSLAAVVITLLAGAVLGPEAGLLALGAGLGTGLARLGGLDVPDARMVRAGALGGIVGLGVNMFAGSTIQITGNVDLEWVDLAWSLPVAVVAALVIVAVRLPAYRLREWADRRPVAPARVIAVGFVIAGVAIVGYLWSGTELRMILGSGEGFIAGVVQVSSLGTLAVILVAKAVAYSLCLGGGLRGGPIFPAMFLGAATAAGFALIGSSAEVSALVAAGVSAAFCVGLQLPTIGLVAAAAAAGLLLGDPWLIGPSIVGVLVGRLVGRALNGIPGVGPAPEPVAAAG